MATPRRSLSKAQLSTAVGLELCQLLEEITDDGKLDIEEVNKLMDWLVGNQGAQLPAIDHLVPVMSRISEDGVITPVEIELLHDEIEKVLPRDIRELVKFKRKHTRLGEKEKVRSAKVAAKKKESRAPISRFDFMVAGVNYDGRDEKLNAMESRLLSSRVSMVLEPENPYDSNAVAIHIAGEHVGYAPRGEAEWLAPELRRGLYQAHVKKLLDGHRCPIPVISGTVSSNDVPAPITEFKSSESDDTGFVGWIAVAAVIVIVALTLFAFGRTS